MVKHTPGPWHVSGPEGLHVTELPNGPAELGYIVAKCPDRFVRRTDVAQANARLIAAAPELLAALQAIVSSLAEQDEEGLVEHAEPMVDARAAIAKATGEAS